MLSAMAVGRSRIEGLSPGSDVHSTAAALRAMGARVDRRDGAWEVDGLGTGGLLQPRRALDIGNSGTSTRLLLGLIPRPPVTANLAGAESLRRRPIDRGIATIARLVSELLAGPGRTAPPTPSAWAIARGGGIEVTLS